MHSMHAIKVALARGASPSNDWMSASCIAPARNAARHSPRKAPASIIFTPCSCWRGRSLARPARSCTSTSSPPTISSTPNSVGLTTEALHALRRNLADALDGRAPVEELRRRARRDADGPARVRRRPGDPPVAWHRGPWPANVTDVLSATEASYPNLVEAWARAVRATLDAHLPPEPTRPR